MEKLAARVALRYARPLAQMTFPHLVGASDASNHFGFVVDYRQGGDESLALHADASVATLNVRLGSQPFEGGELCFRGLRMVDDQPKDVDPKCLSWDSFRAGEAILHLGAPSSLSLRRQPCCHCWRTLAWPLELTLLIPPCPHTPCFRYSRHPCSCGAPTPPPLPSQEALTTRPSASRRARGLISSCGSSASMAAFALLRMQRGRKAAPWLRAGGARLLPRARRRHGKGMCCDDGSSVMPRHQLSCILLQVGGRKRAARMQQYQKTVLRRTMSCEGGLHLEF